ncbi:MAG: hypothetical protein ACYC96_11515 [Fimbriimonadaceae bacterium]
MLVSLFMDVEDPVNPLADDAAMEFAELFSAAGVVGSFCVTGEKCRTLLKRGRRDVLQALAPHAHGLHTDTHSFHPSTMEMLADCSFAEGCERAYTTEQRGYAAFDAAFGRSPSFWGGAGNTWSPEITDALRRLNVPAYVYALTEAPHAAVHRFNGVLALPQAISISESDWSDDSLANDAMDRALAQIKASGQPWLGLFVGHPTKMRHEDYWDTGYYGGRTPPSPEMAEPVPEPRYQRAKANLSDFLARVQKVASVIAAPTALPLPWAFRAPTSAEREYFAERTAANLRSAIGWPVHRQALNAENIVAKTIALAHTLEIAITQGRAA